MKRLLIVTTCSVAAVIFAPGAIAEEGPLTRGPGAVNCTVFLQSRNAEGEVYEALFVAWAQGFFGATNYERKIRGATTVDMGRISFEEMMLRLRGHCERNPEKTYVDGVMTLYVELAR